MHIEKPEDPASIRLMICTPRHSREDRLSGGAAQAASEHERYDQAFATKTRHGLKETAVVLVGPHGGRIEKDRRRNLETGRLSSWARLAV